MAQTQRVYTKTMPPKRRDPSDWQRQSIEAVLQPSQAEVMSAFLRAQGTGERTSGGCHSRSDGVAFCDVRCGTDSRESFRNCSTAQPAVIRLYLYALAEREEWNSGLAISGFTMR